MSIDVEALTVKFLRGQSAVSDVAGDRVYTDMPHDRDYPLILVNRVGGGSLYRDWLEAAEITVGCYGGTHKQAYSLAQTCIAVMSPGLVGKHSDGVVTKFKSLGVAYDPAVDSTDPQGHARPRFVISATVTAHP